MTTVDMPRTRGGIDPRNLELLNNLLRTESGANQPRHPEAGAPVEKVIAAGVGRESLRLYVIWSQRATGSIGLSDVVAWECDDATDGPAEGRWPVVTGVVDRLPGAADEAAQPVPIGKTFSLLTVDGKQGEIDHVTVYSHPAGGDAPIGEVQHGFMPHAVVEDLLPLAAIQPDA